MSWCTIESDPGVFTELIHDLGYTDVQLEEIWSTDQLTNTNSQFSSVSVHGLIFLFQMEARNLCQQYMYSHDLVHVMLN